MLEEVEWGGRYIRSVLYMNNLAIITDPVKSVESVLNGVLRSNKLLRVKFYCYAVY